MPFAPIMFANGTSPGDDSAHPDDWTVPSSAAAAAPPQLAPTDTSFPPASPTGAAGWPGLIPPPPNSFPWSAGLPWGLVAPPAAEPTLRAPLTTPAWVTNMSLLGRIGQMENPFVPGGPPRDMSMSLFPRPPGASAVPNDPGRDGLLGLLPKLWESGAGQSNRGASGASYQTTSQTSTDDLVRSGLPLSKFGAPFFPIPPPQLSISPPSWLDVARFLAPNLVDYFTKTPPPPAPFPSVPGKIPSADANPYAGPALVDAVNLGTTVLGGIESLGPVLAAKAPMLAMPGLPAADLAAARRAQLAINRAAGSAFEQSTALELQRRALEAGPQLTLELPSGVRIRPDFVTRDPVTGEIGCVECKSSSTAPIRSNQARAFSEMERTGATIKGKGKPSFPGGMQIPPTRVEVRRPEE
jgi:hypothetical protein